jgi:hypothetical protein
MALPWASLVIGNRPWMGLAVALLAGAILLLLGAYGRAPTDGRTRLWGGLLKAAGLSLLALCLVEPLWSGARAKPGENLFLLVGDNSASLQIQSEPGQTRGAWLKGLLTNSEATWQVRLAQDFDVRRYLFDSRLVKVESFDALSFGGASSSLHGVLTSLAERYAGRPLAGVLLFTDGNATDAGQPFADLPEGVTLPPIYPVLPPGHAPPPDLSVTRVSVSETLFEDTPITVQVEVAATGLTGEPLVLELVDEQGTVVQQSRHVVGVDAAADGSGPDAEGVRSESGRAAESVSTRFQARPAQPGLTFYTVRVARDEEAATVFTDPARTSEATQANNRRLVAVNREGRPFRVLYVGGRPNWEYRFLHRSVVDDPQVELVGFLRIARKEAKFDFRGRADESSNPLFRGFKKDGDEETETYDEPVIVRLGTRDPAELRTGFPREKTELFAYDALILDDVEAAFFTRDQLTLIERFTAQRGGGVMMLGGIDAFREGGYDRTPVADLLPVYLDRAMAGPPAAAGYQFRLTRDGWLQPWMRLRSNEQDERTRLAGMPPFRTVTRLESVKPGARVLATVGTENEAPLPAVVAQRYGAGRSMAVLIGDLWRWSLQRPEGADNDLPQAWRQWIRWMVSENPRRLEVVASPSGEGPHSPVTLAIRARDAEYQPLENPQLTVRVTPPGGSPVDLQAEPSSTEAGLYVASFAPREAGAYRADVSLKGEPGEPRQSVAVGWTSNPAADEFRQTAVDTSAMQRLAAQTGGEVVSAAELESFVASLPTRRVPVTETWTSPLWHRSWMFALVLLCLIGEWGLRRLRGLP